MEIKSKIPEVGLCSEAKCPSPANVGKANAKSHCGSRHGSQGSKRGNYYRQEINLNISPLNMQSILYCRFHL